MTPEPIPHAPESAGEVLRAVADNLSFCPICDADRDRHNAPFSILHKPGCRLAAALAAPTPAPSGDEVADLRAENERLKDQAHDLGNRAVGAEARAETAETERDVLRENRDALAHGEKAALELYGIERLRSDAVEGQVKKLAKRIRAQRVALQQNWQIQERRNPQNRIRLDTVRSAIIARRAAEARVKVLEEALRRISDATPRSTNSATAEQMRTWCRAVAETALSQHQKGEGHGE